MNSTSEAESLPDDARIGRTALEVADLDEVVSFYRRVVGLDVISRAASRATLGSGGDPLLVVEATEAAARPDSAAGLFHTAFRVPTRGALGDALERIADNWLLDGASDHRVSEALYLSDPEGNGVEIYRDRPREAWPMADDGTVKMATDPLDTEAVAAAAADGEAAPPGTDVGHVHLEVSSLSAFETFYVDSVGFDSQATTAGARFVGAGGYHHHVGANVWNGRTTRASGRGLAWFEVLLPETAALEAVRERLLDRDIDITATDAGFEAVDSDGIRIRFRTDG